MPGLVQWVRLRPKALALWSGASRALRLLFRPPRSGRELSDLPTFRGGGMLVDVAERDALYDAMENR